MIKGEADEEKLISRPDLVEQLAKACSFFWRKIVENGVHIFLPAVKPFEKLQSLVSNCNVNEAAIFFTYDFFNKPFRKQPVCDAAGITHFIKHPVPDLKC